MHLWNVNCVKYRTIQKISNPFVKPQMPQLAVRLFSGSHTLVGPVCCFTGHCLHTLMMHNAHALLRSVVRLYNFTYVWSVYFGTVYATLLNALYN